MNQQSGDDSETTTTKIDIVVLTDVKAAKQWLSQQSEVDVLSNIANSIQISAQGDQESHADLLAAMIAAGIRVANFSSKQKSLEDVFLSVTRGKVQ